MADRESELRVKITEEGGEEAARKLKGVETSQREVADGTRETGKAATEAAGQTEKLTASEGDHIDLLRRINPALGDAADAGLKFAKVLGDMGTASLDSGKLVGTATGFVKKHGDMLMTLGAGGAAGGAVMFLIHTVRKLGEEHEAAAKAAEDSVRRQTEALAKLRDERRSMIEQLVTAGREDADIDEVRAIAKGVEKRLNIDRQVAEQVAVMTAGRDFSQEQQEQVAVGLMRGILQPTMEEGELRAAMGETSPLPGELEKGRARLRSEVERSRAAAAQQFAGGTGEVAQYGPELLAFVEERFKKTGEEAVELIRKAQEIDPDRPDRRPLHEYVLFGKIPGALEFIDKHRRFRPREDQSPEEVVASFLRSLQEGEQQRQLDLHREAAEAAQAARPEPGTPPPEQSQPGATAPTIIHNHRPTIFMNGAGGPRGHEPRQAEALS